MFRLCLLAPLACTPTPSPAAASASAPETTVTTVAETPPPLGWVDAGGGLSVALELPAAPVAVGGSVPLRLHFRNTGATPLRIYMIQSEVFRSFQSSLQVFAADGKFLGAQPEPHPHGYVVGERDFPAIAPGATVVQAQTLHLGGRAFVGQTGPLRLRWTYSNAIESWKGGVTTLDGPTKSLFGGGPIPGIWRGEVVVETSLPLAP